MSSIKAPLLAVFRREVERIKHNPANRFLLFTGPVVGIFILYLIFRQGVVRELPVALVDQDNSTLSAKISAHIDAASDVALAVRVHDLFQARELLETGKVEAIVLIPSETEKKVFQGIEAPIPIYINGANVLKAGLIQRSVLTSLKTVSAGIQLKKQIMAGKNQQEAMTRVMPIQLQKHVLFNPYTNYNYFLNSAMLYVMLYLFVFLSSIYSLGNELKRGTGHELMAFSNQSVRMALVGKMLPYTIIFSGFAMLVNLILFQVEGMPLRGNFGVLFVGQFVTIVAYQLMGLIFVGVTSNLRLALSLGSAYSMLGITFSGVTFPFEAMPAFGRFIAALFPFTWWEN